MSKRLVATVLLVTALSNTAWAGGFGFKVSPQKGWPQVVGKYCCDDYVPKCLPSAKPVCKFVCDDYLPKCAPCIKPVCGYVCDDYCPKSLPVINCPRTDHLKCPPPTAYQLPKADAR